MDLKQEQIAMMTGICNSAKIVNLPINKLKYGFKSCWASIRSFNKKAQNSNQPDLVISEE